MEVGKDEGENGVAEGCKGAMGAFGEDMVLRVRARAQRAHPVGSIVY